ENDRLHLVNEFLYHNIEKAHAILRDLGKSESSSATPSFTRGYLQHAANRRLSILEGHAGVVDQVATIAHPNGKRLAVSISSMGHKILLWDLDQRTVLRSISRGGAILMPCADGRSFWIQDRACAKPDEFVTFDQLDALSLESIQEPLRVTGL